MALNREIFLRNPLNEDEKENLGRNSKSKKRHSIGSTIINSVLNSEVSKSIFKSNTKRKFRDINVPNNLNIFMSNYSNAVNGINLKEKDLIEKENGNGSEEML